MVQNLERNTKAEESFMRVSLRFHMDIQSRRQNDGTAFSVLVQPGIV